MISVIIPVHNKLPHLNRSIDSVLKQSFTCFELIIVDDASTDGSSDKLRDFDDPRITILRREVPGPGGYAARNLGIEKATYNWISFLDADDEWDEHYLQHVSDVIAHNQSVDFITVGWERVHSSNRTNTLIESKELWKEFSFFDYINDFRYVWTGATSIKKDLITEVGGFPSNKCCTRGGDIDTWLRCLYASHLNIHICKPLARYYEDTLNRVTDHSRNPSSYFCAYDTLISILHKTESRKDKILIKNYINKKILHILIRIERMDRDLIRKIYLNSYSIPRLLAFYAKSVFR